MRAHMPRYQRIAVIGGARCARGGGRAAGTDDVLDDDLWPSVCAIGRRRCAK